MKLLCWNIGIKIDNTKEVIKYISNLNPDIITLQEVLKAKDNNTYEIYKSYNYIEEILNNNKFSSFAPVWGAKQIIKNGLLHHDFGGFVEQGTYILSNYKIKQSDNQFYYLEYINSGFNNPYFKKGDHPRSIQNTILEIDNVEVQIINVHGIWNERKMGDDRTLDQCKFIIEKAFENDYPTIVVGDFNLLPTSNSIELLNKKFRNLIIENDIISTRPIFNDRTDKENIVCDYIFVNDKIKVNNFFVDNNNISDHMPLILDFEIKK